MEAFAHNGHTQGEGMPRADKCKTLDELDRYWQMEFMDENWEILYLEEIQQILESVMDRWHPKFQQTIGLFNMEPKGEKEALR